MNDKPREEQSPAENAQANTQAGADGDVVYAATDMPESPSQDMGGVEPPPLTGAHDDPGRPGKSAERAEPKDVSAGGKAGVLGAVLGGFALVLTLLLGGGAYWFMDRVHLLESRLNMDMQAQTEDMERLGADTRRVKLAVEERLEALARSQKRLAEGQADLQTAMGNVRLFAAKGPEGWVLAEVEYLMRIANHRLMLQQDPVTAEVAMRAADQRLRSLNDPVLVPVREKLAAEINALGALPKPDLEGMGLSLDALAESVSTLPLRTMIDAHREGQDEPASADTSVDRSIGEAMDVALDNLKGLVTVRRHNRPVQALLSPKEAFFLRENLRLRLYSARSQLLDGEAVAARADLDVAHQWLAEHFVAADPAVAHMMGELERIRGANVAVSMPDISGSLRALREAMARMADAVAAGGVQ
ncbi:MAG: uroporphyrinogen-III C-methyltransferase [Gammaproteobacteria bacterium]